ncbi:hypothetical protein ACOME3_005460 [Neoechinorhynchus agilis]
MSLNNDISRENSVNESEGLFYVSTIDDWEKEGEGLSAHIVYIIRTKEYVNGEEVASYNTKRRFNNFVSMHDKLIEKLGRKGYFIPPQPEKNFIGATRAAMTVTNKDVDPTSRAFIEKRILVLERYLNRLGAHEVINKDINFIEFVKSEFEYVQGAVLSTEDDLVKLHASKTAKILPSITAPLHLLTKTTGLMAGIIFGSRSNKIESDDDNEFFLELASEASVFTDTFKTMIRVIHGLCNDRKEYIHSVTKFALSLQMLSNAENNVSLSHGLELLAHAFDLLVKENNALLETEQNILLSYAKDYVGYYNNIQFTLDERSHLRHVVCDPKRLKKWRTTVEASMKKHDIDNESNQLTELDPLTQLESLSKTIEREKELFNVQRREDFRRAMTSYLEAYKAFYQNMQNVWQMLQSSLHLESR